MKRTVLISLAAGVAIVPALLSLLPLWDDLLPDYPADIAEADARTVAATLLHSFGGRLTKKGA